jgi:tRNA A-37 threonylcarbamoyl transferase component Bud32
MLLHKAICIEKAWVEAIDNYLNPPLKDQIWRSSKVDLGSLPRQGWKLHISATIHSAPVVFSKIVPVLTECNITFKAAKSVSEIKKINCGLYYGFSQVGKIITAYPESEEAAVDLAFKLHELTCNLEGPIVPFDKQISIGSLVFYRYGVFRSSLEKTGTKAGQDTLITPEGELLPDRREAGYAVPDWLDDPFEKNTHRANISHRGQRKTPLRTTFKAYRCLSQRGKGGVYEALDLSVTPARRCILKEGRKYGEVDLIQRDGRYRVRNEAKYLRKLNILNIQVPKIYQVFNDGENLYLAMEYLNGTDLHTWIDKNKKASIIETLEISQKIASILEDLHGAHIAWRDCKPRNFIYEEDKKLIRPIDFEGACMFNSSEYEIWGSPGYVPPEVDGKALDMRNVEGDDLYALGATLHHLFSRKAPVPGYTRLRAIGIYRKNIPFPVQKLISELLSLDPSKRPRAFEAALLLSNEIKKLRKSSEKAHAKRKNVSTYSLVPLQD